MERGSTRNIPDTPFAAPALPDERHAIETAAPTGSLNRSQSLESRHSSMGSTGWRIRDDDMAEDDHIGDASSRSTAAKDKWKKSLRLVSSILFWDLCCIQAQYVNMAVIDMLLLQVAKGIAFSRTFSTLRDMTEENYIDPSR